jgi:hypothetical protein
MQAIEWHQVDVLLLSDSIATKVSGRRFIRPNPIVDRLVGRDEHRHLRRLAPLASLATAPAMAALAARTQIARQNKRAPHHGHTLRIIG